MLLNLPAEDPVTKKRIKGTLNGEMGLILKV